MIDRKRETPNARALRIAREDPAPLVRAIRQDPDPLLDAVRSAAEEGALPEEQLLFAPIPPPGLETLEALIRGWFDWPVERMPLDLRPELDDLDPAPQVVPTLRHRVLGESERDEHLGLGDLGGNAAIVNARISLPAEADSLLIESLARIPIDAEGRSALALVVERLPRPLVRCHLIVSAERRPAPHTDPMILSRQPGLANDALLTAWTVDGEPFATKTPGLDVQRYKRAGLHQSSPLKVGPRTLNGASVAGAVVEAIADAPLTDDERSPLRADLLRLSTLAYALVGTATITVAEGAILTGGSDTPANRRRFGRAVRAARSLEWRSSTAPLGYNLVDAEGGGETARLGPPRWWLEKTGPMAFRLTGSLFRLATKWGALERTVAGLEGALAWGPSAGRGKGGRLPDCLRPERRGGPGPQVFVPWWQLLRLAGDHVGPDADPKQSEGRRYRRRVESLRSAGYFAPSNGVASAGDTVEVVQQVRGGRGRPAGVLVRASARWCAIYGAPRGEKHRIPATRLLRS